MAPVLNEHDSTVLGVVDLHELVSLLVSRRGVPLLRNVGSLSAKEVINLFGERTLVRLGPQEKCETAIKLFATSCHR